VFLFDVVLKLIEWKISKI